MLEKDHDISRVEFICAGCGRTRRAKVFPYRCSCHTTYLSKIDYILPKEIGNGLGDVIAKGLKKVGIRRRCGSCSRRQALLNKIGRRVKHAVLPIVATAALWLHPR